MEFTIDDGLTFVSERNRAQLDRELSELRREHDEAGHLWSAALAAVPQ